MKTLLVAFCRDQKGTTAMEYAVIATIVSIVIVGGASSIGVKLSGYFSKVGGNLS